MSKQIWKPSTLLAPIPPVMVTCGDINSTSNIITIAWTGIVNTIPPMTYISVRRERYSYNIIKDSGEFVINLTTADLARATDFCGVRSGTAIDKFSEMKLTKEQASIVKCPCIKESPINIECRVKQVIELGSHDMFLSEILAVSVDENIIDNTGRLCIDKASLLAFAHGEYFELGKCIGSFGYSVKKKKKRRGRSAEKNGRQDKPR